MTPQDLKNSILQLAMQGKLVEQRAEEGTAEELFIKIIEERKDLIRQGKVKKDTRIDSFISFGEELPYDIPKNWKWVFLGSVLNKLTDGTHKTPKYTLNGVKFVSVKDMSSGKLSLKNTKYISKEEHNELFSRCNPEKGDLLLSKVGTTGVPAIIDTDEEFSLFVSVALLKLNQKYINNKFLYYLLMSPLVQEQAIENTRGVGNKNWVLDAIAKTSVVLPPVKEQERIVAKIEEFLPLVEQYGKAYENLETFNASFPEDMKKSILQYAMQGKLVEQRAEEGTAEELYRQIQQEKAELIKSGKIKKEKPLPDITEDEIPFDIPENWKWVRLNDISLQIGDIDHKMPEKVEYGIPYISPLDFTKKGIDYDNAKKISKKDFMRLSKKCQPCKNDIIFPRYGTIGIVRLVETNRDFLVSYSCCTIKSIRFVNSLYVFYILQSDWIKNEINKYINKTTQPNIGLESIKKFMIPLPPMEEQNRIIAKIEELLPYCERLK